MPTKKDLENPASPRVSVLMNCYNGEKYLKEAIDSVYAQTFSNWEIIFWDNHSQDRSAEIAKSYHQIDQRLRYFRGDHTVPLYAARNLALPQTRGDFIAVLDCDDIWLPTKLEKQVPLFNDPKVGLVFSDTYYFTGEKIIKQLYQDRNFSTGSCFRELLLDHFLSLETTVYRKAALDSLDYYFDDRFDMVGDADIARRIALQWHLAMVNEPLAKWRIHENNLSLKKFHKHIEETELLLQTYQKNIPQFSEIYAAECHAISRSIAIMKSKQSLLRGEARLGREQIEPYRNSLKGFLIYLASFFPTAILKIIDQRMSKVQ